MKKLIPVFLFMVCLLIVSCTSTPSSKTNFDIQIEYESDNPVVTLQIVPNWIKNFIYKDGAFSDFTCFFTNNTEKTVQVVWAESSVNYNGSSYVPLLEGQKYEEAQNPMSPAVISKAGTISKKVMSSNQLQTITDGWILSPIESPVVELLFMIKSDAGEEYITATVKTIIASE